MKTIQTVVELAMPIVDLESSDNMLLKIYMDIGYPFDYPSLKDETIW